MLLYARTAFARSTPDVLRQLVQLRNLPAYSPGQPMLFALGVPAQTSVDLAAVVAALTSLFPRNVGCISAPPDAEHVSCAVAAFDPGRCLPFRSTVPGRAATQVGRWHAFRDRGKEVDEVLPMPSWGESTQELPPLPPELERFSPRPRFVSSVLYLSDGAPEGLQNSFRRLPKARTLGLIASSTPFLNGRPYTLFHNGEAHSSGAVGIAFMGRHARFRAAFDFESLKPISPMLTVTTSQGNIVQRIENFPAARVLQRALHHSGLSPADDLFLGTLKDTNDEEPYPRLYRIVSGDPSRGMLALDADAIAPAPKSSVRIYARPRTVTGTGTAFRSPTGGAPFSFLVTPANVIVPNAGVTVAANAFVAGSENGFVARKFGAETPPWKCTVVGAQVGLRWQKKKKKGEDEDEEDEDEDGEDEEVVEPRKKEKKETTSEER